jgi:putative methionine-R-sulfoxide reductase with GAF domain
MAQEMNEGRNDYKYGGLLDDDEERDNFEYDRLKKRRARFEKEGDNIKRAIQDQKYNDMVAKFQDKFDKLMKALLEILTQSKRYETHIANLATRLDYNGFYSMNLLNDDIIQI